MSEFFLIIKMILQIVKWAKELSEFVKDNKEEKWFKELSETFGKVNNAIDNPSLSKEERSQVLKNHARSLGSIFSKL